MRARGALGVVGAACALALLLGGCSSDDDPTPSGSAAPSGSATQPAGPSLAGQVLEQVSATPDADLGHATISDRDGHSVLYTVTTLHADGQRTLLTLSVRNESTGQPFIPSAFSGVENAFGHDLHGLAIADKAGNLRVAPYRYQLVPDKPTMACVCVQERFLKDVPQQWTVELPPISAGATTVDVQIPDDRGTSVFGPVKVGATIKDVPVSRG
jgi:hypothetical protein